MANKVYCIADTHFSHKAILEYSAPYRPFSTIEEHDNFLVESWNSIVDKRDTVWHLGDVVLGGVNSLSILSRCNGIKKLIMGNHDRYPTKEYLKYFNAVYGAIELKGALLSHIPVADTQKYRYRCNIHGHMHDGVMEDPWYKCVSVERTGLKPILLKEVLNDTTTS